MLSDIKRNQEEFIMSKQSKKELCRVIFNDNNGQHATPEQKTHILELFTEEAGAAKSSAIVYYSQIKNEANNEVANTDPSVATVTNTLEDSKETMSVATASSNEDPVSA